jgi:hypothetical protein
MTRPSEIARARLSPSTVQPELHLAEQFCRSGCSNLWAVWEVKCPGPSLFQGRSRGFSPGWLSNYSPIRWLSSASRWRHFRPLSTRNLSQ